MECQSFDAQVASPKGQLKSLQKEFIRLRIVNMKDVDIGLFEFDFDTTFAIFVLNHKEQIYLRYGSHDDRSAYSFLSIKSLNYALEEGLTLHKEWKKGELKLPERPKKKLSNSYSYVKQVIDKGKCVHCHQVASGQIQDQSKTPGFEKKKHVWVYPDPMKFGLTLDPNTGHKVKKVEGAAKRAGLKKRDVIVKVGDRLTRTFTDIQYALHKAPMEARKISMTVLRKKKEVKIDIDLPEHWRVTNISKRSMSYSLTPFPGFWARDLSAKQKRKFKMKKTSFASEVTKFRVNTIGKRSGLRAGDIIYEVNGVRESPLTQNIMLYIRLNYKDGDQITVKALRRGKVITASFKLKAQPY